jgi:hypothetical protein
VNAYPNFVLVNLTTSSPFQSTILQIGTGYIAVVSGDGKPLSYDDTGSYHTFSLTYINTTNLQQDCTLVYNAQQSNLPPGWAVFFNTAVIQAGHSTSLLIQTAPLTIAGNVTISVNALVNSRPIIVQPVVLTQSWVPLIEWNHVNAPTGGCANWDLYLNFMCFNCTNAGNTISETDTYSGPHDTTPMSGNISCSGVGAIITLTDAISLPDGIGPLFNNTVQCEPTTVGLIVDCKSTLPSGREYGFVPPIGCGTNGGYVTLTASMLGQ